MKLWGGRFQKGTAKNVDDFNSSIRFDQRMYKQDIKGSIAHATMLGKQGIIPQEDADKIVAELKNILADIEAGKIEFEIDFQFHVIIPRSEANVNRKTWIFCGTEPLDFSK